MAERRMISKRVVDDDTFLEMPASARLLYYDLAIRADDDGIISPKRIMKMINASDDDLRVLIAKHYVIPFESGVIVIRHWKIHNYIRKDTYRRSIYNEEKRLLKIGKNRIYYLSGEPAFFDEDSQDNKRLSSSK